MTTKEKILNEALILFSEKGYSDVFVGDIAAAVGITTSAYAMYEQGERIPRDDTKVRLANYFNQSINFIFFDDNTHFEL